MDTVELLKIFSDPSLIESLSVGQRMMGGLCTTILGMGITFISLILLQLILSLFTSIMAWSKKESNAHLLPKVTAAKPPVQKNEAEEITAAITATLARRLGVAPTDLVIRDIRKTGITEEIIAAITAALAVQLGDTSSNLIIRDIRKIENKVPTWSKVGLLEEMERFLN